MKTRTNELGQLIGYAVTNYTPPSLPNFPQLEGSVVVVEPISSAHLAALYAAFSIDSTGANWTYLPYGPFASEEEFRQWAMANCFSEDPKIYTIVTDKGPAGIVGYLRIQPDIGSIEIGHVHLSPILQRTRAGTEALLLMIKWAFEAGYRRVEWKCDALNIPSKRAANRLGFSFEGNFRQAVVYKKRNRDTSWYAATSEDWPALKQAYERWLNSNNFTPDGQEIKKLSDLTSSLILKHETRTEESFLNEKAIKELVETYAHRIWDEKDLKAIDELIHQKCVIHSLLGDFYGPKAMENVVEAWLNGFPDLVVKNKSLICEQDRVVIQWQAHGTHQGEFKGIKPTKKSVSYAGVTIYRVHHNKIIEYWAYLDMKHLLDQIN